MKDPRKGAHRPEVDEQDAIRQIANAHLIAVTEQGAMAIGCTGASFVMLGLGIWASELAELDSAATAQMLRSMADIYDPSSNHMKKAHAEMKRRAATRKLFAAVDLAMAEPASRA